MTYDNRLMLVIDNKAAIRDTKIGKVDYKEQPIVYYRKCRLNNENVLLLFEEQKIHLVFDCLIIVHADNVFFVFLLFLFVKD